MRRVARLIVAVLFAASFVLAGSTTAHADSFSGIQWYGAVATGGPEIFICAGGETGMVTSSGVPVHSGVNYGGSGVFCAGPGWVYPPSSLFTFTQQYRWNGSAWVTCGPPRAQWNTVNSSAWGWIVVDSCGGGWYQAAGGFQAWITGGLFTSGPFPVLSGSFFLA